MSQIDNRRLDSSQFKRHSASADTKRKITEWEIWKCSDPEIQYDYDRTVSLFVQEGSAKLTFEDGATLTLHPGDFLTVEKGANVTWRVTSPICSRFRYHDTFESASKRDAQVHWHNL